MIQKRIVIIDIDGVIADAEWRLQFLPSRYSSSFEDDRHPDWDEYQSKSVFDEPIEHIRNLLSAFANTGINVALLTARPEKWREITEEWLDKNNIQYDTLIMKDDDQSNDSAEYKLQVCRSLRKENDILFILDDFEDIIKTLRLENFPAFHFRHYKKENLIQCKKLPELIGKKILITITGPTCSGKTTFLKNLIEIDNRFVQITSTTTRPKREGEKAGSHYYFVSDAEFDSIEMLEKITFAGHRYGAALKDFNGAIYSNKIPLLIVEPNGVRQISNYCAEHKDIQHIKVFLNTNTSATIQRLLKREMEDLKAASSPEKTQEILQIYTDRVIAHMTVERNWKNFTYWHYIVPEYTYETQFSALNNFIEWLKELRTS